MLPNARVMVIGGAGYVGTAFCELLESKGIDFVIYDNFSVGSSENVDAKGWQYYAGDIADNKKLTAAVHDYAPTHVVALAALHFIPYCIANPHEMFGANITGMQNLIDVINDYRGTIELLFISSAAVYFDTDKPLNEQDKPGPIDIYGSSKLIAEQLIDHQLTHYKIIRLFNVYGKTDPHPHVIPRLYNEMSKKPESVQLGNVEPLRDYIHVDDVARGIYAVLSAGKPQETYNLGTGNTYSVGDVVQLLAQQIGHTPKIVGQSKAYTRKRDRMVLQADITKIFEHTGWKPQTTLHEGLKTLR